MKKVLFVGEHPLSQTGNGNMLMAILNQVDATKYQVGCFVANEIDPSIIVYNPLPLSFIPAEFEGNKWGPEKLVDLINKNTPDILCMVGLDIWRYGHVFEQIELVKKKKPFIWIAIFPYDLQLIRPDWLRWINMVDYPCVYSQYGYDLLKDHIPKVSYFRPPLNNASFFSPIDPNGRRIIRQQIFGPVSDKFIFGFIGENQFRKDPQRMIKAFFQAKKQLPNIVLYLHTELTGGAFNLREIIEKYVRQGEGLSIMSKIQGIKYTPNQLADVYNAIDCLVNCSLQEGLSWTLLEAMLAGTPVIASDTTAQTEIVKGAGVLVPCEELTYIPLLGQMGETWEEAKACSVDDMAKAIIRVAKNSALRENMIKNGLKKARDWIKGVSNINQLFEAAIERPVIPIQKIKKILFAQESSAGDVLMTTRCLKPLKEKHGLPLVYMTTKQYQDIVKGNPHVDEVIDWDPLVEDRYEHVYKPHNDRIITGNWGKNSVGLLSDLYWKLLEIEPGEFFIERKKLTDKAIIGKVENSGRICVVHTTGGDSKLRKYKFMKEVIKELKADYYTIQLGSQFDASANAHLDLRGKLTFRESAWVMSHAFLSINVDSFISHLAGAFGINQVVLFGCGSPFATRPVQVKGLLICRSPDYIRHCPLCGHCSGQMRTCPDPCINVHRPKDILSDVKRLEAFNREGEAMVILKYADSDRTEILT